MSTVGMLIRLWCLVRGSSSAFKVVIGDGNDIDDLKEAISNKLPNDVKAIQLVLWNVNIDQSQIKATSIDDILNDEDKLEISGLTIREAFPNIEGNNVRVIVEVPVFAENPAKRRRIEQGWRSYTASDSNSVELPSQIIDMLESEQFAPDSRSNFRTAFQDLHVGQSINLPYLGQDPKHLAENYQKRTLLVTNQMIDIWEELSSTDSNRSVKRVLSGPMGVGKSYISYFLASKAYAEGWIILYIADASDLNVETSFMAGKVICKFFLALNRDILTATDLEKIVRSADNTKNIEIVVIAESILEFLKMSDSKTLLIVDEHGALFENVPSTPERLPVLNAFMSLNYWGPSYKNACVIFTGTAHAKYEKKHVSNGTKQQSVIYVGPLQEDVFDLLLDMHEVMKEQNIKVEVKKVTNCVPREALHLVEFIKTNRDSFQQALKEFEDSRVDEMFRIAREYYNGLDKDERKIYQESLTRMFLPSMPAKEFDWKFLDLGLIYRYKQGAGIRYLPLCPTAQKALLKVYMSFDIPENIKNQLRIGELKGDQFEEALFSRLVCRCGTTIQLESTDLNNKHGSFLTLNFDDYDLIKSPNLSLGPGKERVLGRGFERYPRFDYMIGPVFIQVSISDFQSHNSKSSTDIKQAFEPMCPQAGISSDKIKGRNQIEMYLDEMYGSAHSAKIDKLNNNKFVVTRNGTPVIGFRIVYIRGSPGKPSHSGKVLDFPDVVHVTLKAIKSQLFPNIV